MGELWQTVWGHLVWAEQGPQEGGVGGEGPEAERLGTGRWPRSAGLGAPRRAGSGHVDASLGRIPRCDVAGRAAGRAGHRLWSRGQMGLDRAPGAEDKRGGPGRAQWPGQWAPRSLRQPSWLPAVAVTAAPQSGTGPPHQVAAVCAADPPKSALCFL